MKMLWRFLRLNRLKAALLVICGLIFSNLTTGLEATSKVTWQANRGFPLPFMSLDEYMQGGRCLQNTICVSANIQSFSIYALIVDLLGWYLISCAITFIYEAIIRQWDKSKSGF